MTERISNAYETRNADYSIVHSESEEDFNQFIDALAIKDGEKVIDVGGGYGSIFIHLIQKYPEINFEYDLLDGGMFQLKKGEERIGRLLEKFQNRSVVRYLHQDATELNLQADYYDLVICKMFFHEIPQRYKKDLICNLFSILKPGGRLIVWNPDLDDLNYEFYTNVIKKKDELAGFESLVQNRHFLLNNDFYQLMADAGFVRCEKLLTFDYHLHTVNRVNEEFDGSKAKLNEWNKYILDIAANLKDEAREQLKITTADDNIYINFKRSVFALEKPITQS